MNNLKLQVAIEAADRLSRPFEKMKAATGKFRKETDAATKKLRDLERQSEELQAFQKLGRETKDTEKKLHAAQTRVKAMQAQMSRATETTNQYKSQLRQARKSVQGLEKQTAQVQAYKTLQAETKSTAQALQQAERQTKILKKQMSMASVVTDDMKDALQVAEGQVKSLNAAFNKNTRQLKGQKKRLAEAGINVRKLSAAETKLAKSLDTAKQGVLAQEASLEAASSAAAEHASDLRKLRAEATRLSREVKRGTGTLQKMRQKFADVGIKSRNLSEHQRRLKQALDQARQSVNAKTAALEKQARATERVRRKTYELKKAEDKLAKTQARQGAIAGAGMSGMAAGGAGLAAGGMVAATGINFEEQMSAVAALSRLPKNSEAFQALEKQAQQLGKTTSFSASEAAQGMQFLAMSGFKANEIMAAMPGMLDLAKAGNIDLATAADVASNILSGFGKDASEMGNVADVLAATFTRANVDLVMLGESMKYVGPIAKELGTSIEETSAMAGLLGNVGIQGSEAGTALRAIHNRLAKPPKEGAIALRDLGVETRTASGDLRSMIDILSEVAEKSEGLGNADRIAAFKGIAGAEAGAAMASLVEQGGSGAINEFASILKKSEGEVAKIAQIMGDNTAGDIKAMMSAFEGLNITLTNLNISPLRDLVQSVTAGIRAVEAWVTANPELAATLSKVAMVMAAVVVSGGAIATMIAGVLGPFAMLRFMLTSLGLRAGMTSLAFGGTGSVIKDVGLKAARTLPGMASAGLSMAKVFSGHVAGAIGGFARAVYGKMSPASVASLVKLRAMSRAGLAYAAGAARRFVAAIALQALAMTGTLVPALTSAMVGMRRYAASTWSWVARAVPAFLVASGRIAVSLTATVASALVTGGAKMAGFAATGMSMAGRLAGALPAVAAGIRAIGAAIMANPIGLIIGGIAMAAYLIYDNWEPISDWFSGLWSRVSAVFGGVWEFIKPILGFTPLGALINNWEPISNFFGDLWGSITGMFDAAWGVILSKIDMMKAPLDWIGDKFSSLFGGDDEKEIAVKRVEQIDRSNVVPFPTRAVQTPAPIPTRSVASVAGAAMVAGTISGAQPAPAQEIHITQNAPITIHAPAGMDPKEIADEVARQLAKQQARAQSSARARMYDGTK